MIKMTNNRVLDYINSLWITEQVWYVLSSKGREASKISDFLAEQFNNPMLDAIIVQEGWHELQSEEQKIYSILKWVIRNINYVSDNFQYKTLEYWASISELLSSDKGDCEDAAILIVGLGRKLGIPRERLKLWCGDVYIKDTKTETNINMADITNSKWYSKKAINYGTIKKQEVLGLNKDKDYLLKQSLEKVISLKPKERLLKVVQVILFGNMLKIEKQFVKDVERLIEKNSVFITKIKTDWITLRIIWKLYVGVVMQHIMEKKVIQDNLKKEKHIPILSKKDTPLGIKTTEGTTGHACAIYKSMNYPYVWFFIDWCMEPQLKLPGTTRKSYVLSKALNIFPYNAPYQKGWFVVDEVTGSKVMK